MDDKARLQLQKMIKANDIEDQTNLIRELKHSDKLQKDINNLLLLKAKFKNNQEQINEYGPRQCNFLFTYYTDIYNKIRKDELDLKIMNQFLNVLMQIEDGYLDQHEGAFAVGTLLKELYVDSALKKAEKLDEQYQNEEKEEKRGPSIEISWKQFKQSNL